MKLQLIAALAILVASPAPWPQSLAELPPDDLLVTPPMPLAATEFQIQTVAMAYNPDADEVLLVFDATGEFAGPEWGGRQVFGQRLDAASGTPVGAPHFMISDGLGPGFLHDGSLPRVAYNQDDQEYLVVWNSPAIPGAWYEIVGQRLDGATCAKVGTAHFRISSAGPDGDFNWNAMFPDVTYNTLAREYLVVWQGDDIDGAPGEMEIRAQRLDAATGAEVGPDDLRLTHVGPALAPDWAANVPKVVFNRDANEYLVVFQATVGHAGGLYPDSDIFGQRLSGSTAAEIGADDFRISASGLDGDNVLSGGPQVAYSSAAKRYLAAWASTETLLWDVYGQLLDGSSGAEVGPDDARLTWMAGGTTSGAVAIGAFLHNPTGEFVLTVLGTLSGDQETYALLVDPAAATPSAQPLKISTTGPDGDKAWGTPWATGVSRLGTSEMLFGWVGTLLPGLTYDEEGAFIQRVYACSASPVAAVESVRLGTPPNPAALQGGASGPPRLGFVWDPRVDHTTFLPSAVLDALAISPAALNVPSAFGTLLVNPQGWPVFTAPPSTPFAVPVPVDCAVVGMQLTSQAASLQTGGLVGLTNALDLTLGTD